MVKICVQCGDKGYSNALIFCVKCLEVAVHRYCLDKFPKSFDEFVHWVCDNCECADPHELTPPKSVPIRLERTEYTSPTDEGSFGGQSKKRKIRNSILDSVHVDTVVDLAEDAQLASGTAVELAEDAQLASGTFPLNLKQKMDDVATPTSGTKEQKIQSTSSLQPDGANAKVVLQHTQSSGDNVPWENDADWMMKNMKEKSSRNCSLSEYVNQRLGRSPSNQPCQAYVKNGLNEKAVRASSSPLSTEWGEKAKEHGCQPFDTELQVIEARNWTHEVSPLDRSNLKKRDANCFPADVSNQGLKRKSDTRPVLGHLSNDPTFDYCEHARPLIDPIWSGCFIILNKDYDAFDGLVAHLSSKACHKVYMEASMFPWLLDVEMNPKSELWPKSFEISKPSDDNIAMYFFPMEKRYERMFDDMVEEMVHEKLAMRAILKNAELLIFTSTELPLNYWRFQGKYYLWGVFRGKKGSNSPTIGSMMKIRDGLKHLRGKSWDAEYS